MHVASLQLAQMQVLLQRLDAQRIRNKVDGQIQLFQRFAAMQVLNDGDVVEC